MFEGPFCDPIMLLLWHRSVDIIKPTLLLHFQPILMLCLWVNEHFTKYYYCIGFYVRIYDADLLNQQFGSYFAKQLRTKNILHINIMYLRAYTGVKIPTFLEKNGQGGWDCGSRNVPLNTAKATLALPETTMEIWKKFNS